MFVVLQLGFTTIVLCFSGYPRPDNSESFIESQFLPLNSDHRNRIESLIIRDREVVCTDPLLSHHFIKTDGLQLRVNGNGAACWEDEVWECGDVTSTF